MNERLLTVKELAEYLRCSPNHVRTMVKQGMPCMRLGVHTLGAQRFRLSEVLPWLEGNVRNTQESAPASESGE